MNRWSTPVKRWARVSKLRTGNLQYTRLNDSPMRLRFKNSIFVSVAVNDLRVARVCQPSEAE